MSDGVATTNTTDPKSPYYLHHSDHPGLIFVTHPLNENGENYFTWRKTMLNALAGKNKAGFVDGSIAKPDVQSPDFQSWVQCNAIVLSWLTNALDKDLQSSAAHADTAKEVWMDFEERFTQGLAPRVYDLKRTIALFQQEKAPISTYYGRLKAVWQELQALHPIPICSCGYKCGAAKKMQEMREQEKVYDFLMGLDDSFATVRSQVLSIDPLPTLGRAYAVTAQEEKQKIITSSRTPVIEATTLLARGENPKIHLDNSEKDGNQRRCSYCHKTNHIRENCFLLNGYLENWHKRSRGGSSRGRGGNRGGRNTSDSASSSFAGTVDSNGPTPTVPKLTPKQHEQLMALLGNDTKPPSANLVNNISGKKEQLWVIDTGATDHISCDVKLVEI